MCDERDKQVTVQENGDPQFATFSKDSYLPDSEFVDSQILKNENNAKAVE